MRKIYILLALLIVSTVSIFSQPALMNYQGIARDENGNILKNQPISLKFSIVQDAPDGLVVYSEEHDIITGEQGIFNLHIGSGEEANGNISAINWGMGNYYIRTEIDPEGGNNFALMGTSQLLSVPYAFHSNTANAVTGVNEINTKNGVPAAVWSLKGNSKTDSETDALGTTDSEPLVLITNGIARLTIDENGNISIEEDLTVKGDLLISSTTQSTTTSSGALVVSGGTGIGKNLNVGGITRIWNTTESTTNDEGALQVDGGVGINKNVNIGGNADIDKNALIHGNSIIDGNASIGGNTDVTGNTDLTGYLKVSGVTTLLNTTNSTTKDNGSLVVEGGAGIEKDLNVGGAASIGGNTSFSGDLDINGIVSIWNTTNSSNKDNGALMVDGGVGVEKDLNVGGNTNFTGYVNINSTVQSLSSVDGALIIDGGAGIAKNLNLGGILQIENITNSTNKDNGSLVLQGGAGIEKNLFVGGSINAGATSYLNGLVVKGSGTLGPSGSNHIAYFENTDNNSSADGIGIKISKSQTGEGNNFVTFYSGTGTYVSGRIEGYQHTPGQILQYFQGMKPILDFVDLLGFNAQFHSDFISLGSLPTASFSKGSLPSLDISFNFTDGLDWDWSAGSLPSLSFNGGSLPSINKSPLSFSFNPNGDALLNSFAPLVCEAYENDWASLLQMDIASLATFAARMELESYCKDDGVTFGSKGADYAEWLPKINPEEKYIFGQIVGVHDGKISLNTTGAEQIMSISLAPVVVGNIPPKGEESKYEKVGFMGQVPVIVRGKVNPGDYIIPSGYNDGTGIAVAPGNLKVKHLDQILGRAFSGTEGKEKLDVINVLIGVKTNEWAEIFRQQESEINILKEEVRILKSQANSDKMAELEKENAQIKNELQQIRILLNNNSGYGSK